MKDADQLHRTAFVAMPYGKKREPSGRLRIDFDDIWQSAIAPAIAQAGLEAIRADEELVGGFVHLAMYERLLLSDIVVADLTLASPNVMYELGIRHAARPRTTIPIFAKSTQLPFDLSPIRALPYPLDQGGKLKKRMKQVFVEALSQRLVSAMQEETSDSPLFQLIKQYPGISLPHDATESFQRRVETEHHLALAIRAASRQVPERALPQLQELARKLGPLRSAPSPLLVDLLLAFRAVEGYSEMIALVDAMPIELRNHVTIRQQLAFALNRRAASGDIHGAVKLLTGVINERGDDPETLGLLGRVHKDRYLSLLPTDPNAAAAALEAAISCYERGFVSDHRDYYPGVNAVTLLMVKGTPEALARAKEILPMVTFAVSARRALESDDYWDLASVLELAVVEQQEEVASSALNRMLYLQEEAWKYETTRRNLLLIADSYQRQGVLPPWLEPLVGRMVAPARD